MDLLEKFIHGDFIKQELEFSGLYRYLDRYKDSCSNLYSETKPPKCSSIKPNHTIWIFWKQGMEKAFRLVQKCYESVCKNKPQDFEVILLTEQNLEQYINLPDYIWDKYEKGFLTTTHLSDLIRIELLCVYGGCWIDATVFCSDRIPMYMLAGDLFVFQLQSVLSDPTLKLSSWWIYADKDCRLIHLTRQMLFTYWKQETDIRNYFLLHIIISKIIDEDETCKNLFQKIPYFNSGNAHILQRKLGAEFDEAEWAIIKNASCVHKLTYKNKYLQGDIYNYYMALLSDDLCPAGS